jgi:hypothetical protein
VVALFRHEVEVGNIERVGVSIPAKTNAARDAFFFKETLATYAARRPIEIIDIDAACLLMCRCFGAEMGNTEVARFV